MKTILVKNPSFYTNGEEVWYDNGLESMDTLFNILELDGKAVKNIQVGSTSIKNYNEILNNRKGDNLIQFIYEINNSSDEVRFALVENSDFKIPIEKVENDTKSNIDVFETNDSVGVSIDWGKSENLLIENVSVRQAGEQIRLKVKSLGETHLPADKFFKAVEQLKTEFEKRKGKEESSIDQEDLEDDFYLHVGNGGYTFCMEKYEHDENCIPVLNVNAYSHGHQMNEMKIKMRPEYLKKLGEYLINESEKSKKYYKNRLHDKKLGGDYIVGLTIK